MKNALNKVFGVLLLLVLTINGAACSRLFGPSDKDAIQAINDSGLVKSQSFTLTAPIEIVKKGAKGPDGSWPVTVKLTLDTKMINGETKQLVTTPTFRIFKTKDASGKTVWTARLGG